jgi:hypothetical protein
MKLPCGKFGLKVNPVGAQVKMDHHGNTLLGDVVGCYYNETGSRGMRLKVRHFCGDAWPFDPSPLDVDVLERTYETQEA